jgi:hypothetical protein
MVFFFFFLFILGFDAIFSHEKRGGGGYLWLLIGRWERGKCVILELSVSVCNFISKMTLF